MLQNKDHFLLWEAMVQHQNLNFFKKTDADVVSMGEGEISVCKLMEELAKQKEKNWKLCTRTMVTRSSRWAWLNQQRTAS